MRMLRAALSVVNYVTQAVADATYLALSGGALTGALTVPNGSADTPGLRTTSEAHGLFRKSATQLGLAVAGVARAWVGATGVGVEDAANGFTSGDDGGFDIGNRSKLRATATGFLTLLNAAGSDFNGLRFGGVTSSFPMVQRNGAGFALKLADGSADAAVSAAAVTASGAVTAPDGAAATPGFRTTTEAHGLYRESATELGLAAVGTKVLGLTSTAINLLAAQAIKWAGRVQLSSPADGKLKIDTNAGTAGVVLDGGSVTHRLCVRKSDDTGYGAITCSGVSVSGTAWVDNGAGLGIYVRAGSPEGAVTAVVGSLCLDSTNGEVYVKNSGTGNTGWKLITRAA